MKPYDEHCRDEMVTTALTDKVMLFDAPFSEALTVELCVDELDKLELDTAVALNVAQVELGGADRDPGTVTEEFVLERTTLAPADSAGLERVAVQLVLRLGGRLVLAHCGEETVTISRLL